jgi:hypothetical protein
MEQWNNVLVHPHASRSARILLSSSFSAFFFNASFSMFLLLLSSSFSMLLFLLSSSFSMLLFLLSSFMEHA